ncbi:MAG: hypothetical protein R2716_12540 [Microthrixaceae bacterium]
MSWRCRHATATTTPTTTALARFVGLVPSSPATRMNARQIEARVTIPWAVSLAFVSDPGTSHPAVSSTNSGTTATVTA